MTIPPEILELAEQLRKELDGIERQANKGLAIASQVLEHFPNNVTLITLFASLGNALFFVSGFRQRIDDIIQQTYGNSASNEAIQEAGEELSEMWGRILECKIRANRLVDILETLR